MALGALAFWAPILYFDDITPQTGYLLGANPKLSGHWWLFARIQGKFFKVAFSFWYLNILFGSNARTWIPKKESLQHCTYGIKIETLIWKPWFGHLKKNWVVVDNFFTIFFRNVETRRFWRLRLAASTKKWFRSGQVFVRPTSGCHRRLFARILGHFQKICLLFPIS